MIHECLFATKPSACQLPVQKKNTKQRRTDQLLPRVESVRFVMEEDAIPKMGKLEYTFNSVLSIAFTIHTLLLHYAVVAPASQKVRCTLL